jgi:hypothetical protein
VTQHSILRSQAQLFAAARTPIDKAMLYALRHNQAMTTEPRKRFSMIREFHFADWFTLGNAGPAAASRQAIHS